jgi:predicted O-linked N-acetylglucosamine transferase (SPINDLY family)
VAADPGDARFHFGLASTLETLRQWDQALDAYLAALECRPGLPEAVNGALFMTRATCAWEQYPALAARFREAIAHDKPGLSPFVALAEPLPPEEQLRCARTWSREKVRRAGQREIPSDTRPRKNRGTLITVGYLTSEFRRHPTAYTKVGLFEHHDRSRFRVIGYCNGDDDGSDIRRRIVAAVDEFVDLRGLRPGEAAESIRRDSPDVLIDLKGHTENALTEALALRPAPVQAAWVGFPGSTGADFIDYAIVDPVVVPETEAGTFSESLIWLPETYWAEDDRRARPGPAPSRPACGLPESAVVLACFNNSYKLHPDTFDFWMSLLRDLDNTVLWLQDTNPRTRLKDNLRGQAAARGVAPERIIFCPKLPLEDYLARYQVADLFIDTLPYNAHTTAADALWTGLPVVSLPGRTMASRVAASLLQAAGLGDLVVHTKDEYRSLVSALVDNPARLEALKARVASRVPASPLFDTARFTRHFESALSYMARRARSGLPPAPARIAPVANAEEPAS